MHHTTRGAPEIQICSLDRQAGTYTDSLSGAIARAFGLEVRPILMLIDLTQAYDPRRDQLEAMKILRILGAVLPSSEGKVIAVTTQDLYTPVLSFVFGEAELGGRFGVVSLCRLRPSFYGLPENPELLRQRAEKESVHEVGHTLGLTHCPFRLCAMHGSTYAEDIDIKGMRLCADCRKLIPHRAARLAGRSAG